MKPVCRPQRGVALVIVLCFLVLLSMLVIGLLMRAKTESASGSNYQAGVQVKQLAASTVGLVSGQILDATHTFKSDDPGSGRVAWASQPGLIRTWDDRGKGWKVFKLYSAKDMVADFDSNGRYSVKTQLPTEVPYDWPSQTAHFVDLNQPVMVEDSNGKIVRNGKTMRASYPIIDPLASIANSTPPVLKPVDGFQLGPSAANQNVPPVPGFSGTVTESLDPSIAPAGKTGNPAPMPVRWVYVLQDGTFTVPTDALDNGKTASWKNAKETARPTRANPIVGRVAFWTDDETCKLNVNTASEPTPWDTPRAVGKADLNYGQFQPAQREFQRFPGHPSTSALSPVFFPGVTLTTKQKEDIYGLLPRVQPGGSTVATVNSRTSRAITLDSDRLYTNVDEFVFRPEMPGIVRTDNNLIDSQRLRRARFFLTANSRAPELNLYGLPRVALWPVNSKPGMRTAFDQLSAFCSTIGTGATGMPFYFQRSDATSPTADYVGIKRNQDLYAYLRRLTSTPIPGYGGTFSDKWQADRDQILTEVFDYVRSTNLRDPNIVATNGPLYSSNGQVTPIRIGQTLGFGRFNTISQFGMHFICNTDAGNGAPPLLQGGERAVEAGFMFEPFCPSVGYYSIRETMSYQVSFKSAMSLDGVSLGFPTASPITVSSPNGGFNAPFHSTVYWGGGQGVRGTILAFGGANYPLRGANRAVLKGGKQTMDFSGGAVEVSVYSGASPSPANLIQKFTVNFPPAQLPVPKLVTTGTTPYRGRAPNNGTNADYWWTLSSRYGGVNETNHAPGAEYADPTRRWGTDNAGNSPGFKKGGVFRAEDVLRTLVPEHGDIRLIAADPNGGTFVPGAGYRDTTRYLDHIFTEPLGSHFLYGFGNEPGLTSPLASPGSYSQLTPVTYHYARLPEITPGAGQKYNKWNDYDNGFAQTSDGAFINKPDEGNIAIQNSAYSYFTWEFTAPNEQLFSPSRLIPSAGMLGSLPTGVKRNQPWQTLLFRPEVRKDSNGQPHPGTLGPKDHLFMDLFWTPVVEPYAISEPFSTAGKINLNYEIAPFNYIRRATALYGAMKAEEPLVLPHGKLGQSTVPASKIYKLWDHESNDWPSYPDTAGKTQDPVLGAEWRKLVNGTAPYDQLRRPIDVSKTLVQADERFVAGEIFRSASEICELHLVRNGETLDDYKSGKIWQDAQSTGENTRERPYSNLYGRLTTRSNTFTVHMRVQVLRQGGIKDSDFEEWREDKSTPLGEYRGSSVIERYIDPASPNLVDFADPQKFDATTDVAYRMRTISTRKFTP